MIFLGGIEWGGVGGIQFGGQLTPDSAQGQQEGCLSANLCVRVSEQKQQYLRGRDGIASHLAEIIGRALVNEVSL